MNDEQKEKALVDTYEDFLGEISRRFARKGQERDFIDSIGHETSMEDIEVSVGERVKQVREKQGLSLQDIFQRTDIDVSLLEEIEAGKVAPPLGTVIKLAKALEMKMGYFISGEEDHRG